MRLRDATRALVATAIVLGAGVATAQDFEGLYRPDQPWAAQWTCRASDFGQDGGAVGVIDGYLEGVENRCLLTNPRPGPTASSRRFTTVCSGEGSPYTDEVILARTATGISLTRNGSTVYWRSCDAARTTVPGKWAFDGQIAGVAAGDSHFGISCKPITASGTTPVAHISGYCPMCPFGAVSQFRLSVDGAMGESFDFEKISNADGWVSDLYYYPQWFDGLIDDLISGHRLVVYEGREQIANFPLRGSAAALRALRQSCR